MLYEFTLLILKLSAHRYMVTNMYILYIATIFITVTINFSQGDGTEYSDTEVKQKSIKIEDIVPEIKFTFWYTKNKVLKYKIINPDNLSNMKKKLLQNKRLKVFTNGYLASKNSCDNMGIIEVMEAYCASGMYTSIIAGWAQFAKKVNYEIAATWAKQLGDKIAELLKNIVRLNVIKPSDIHIIGHGLGAHIAGECGKSFQSEGWGKIYRITGLDPAATKYLNQYLNFRLLNSDDAKFVDVIHTDPNNFGYPDSLGSADFYPNGKEGFQPGCNYFGCSHFRAYDYYLSSVFDKHAFLSVRCDSWKDFIAGNCSKNQTNHMGHEANPNLSGDFYLETNSTYPFSKKSKKYLRNFLGIRKFNFVSEICIKE